MKASTTVDPRPDAQILRVDGREPISARRALQLVEAGHLLRSSGQVVEALRCYETSIAVDPACVPGLVSLGEVLSQVGQPTLAVDSYLQALQQDPGHVVARVNLAALLQQGGHSEDAVSLLEPIADCHDDVPTVRFNLAGALAEVGRFAEAQSAYIQILATHPRPAKVLYNLAQVMRFRAEDRERLEGWRGQVAARLHDAEDRIHFHFALGKAYDDLGESDLAWTHFAHGNSLVPVEFSPARYAAAIDRSIRMFSPQFFRERTGWGRDTDKPVFIVGMPRSGTSLVEQILSAHSQVQAGGERREIGELVATFAASQGREADDALVAASLTREDFAAMADRYAERAFATGAARTTDKMPANYRRLGWIAVCFPKARVIHCRRDPRDSALSCYFQHFTSRLPFAYDLDHLVACTRGYQRLMDHWRANLPLPVLEVDYESLVESPEEVSRRLVEFCGLPWEPACLRSHESRRAVTTASQWQVRQPVYRTSLARWKRYESHIEPLLDAFGRD